MKIIKVMRLLALTLVATTVAHLSFAAESIYPSLDENLLRDEIAVATAIAEIKVKEAQKIINDTRQQALQGKIAPITAVKIIKEQNAIIDSIESALKNKIESAITQVKKADEEQSYLSSFVSGAQDLGSRAIAPFKAGYGYTEEQKKIAQQVIDGLMEQQSQLTKDYEKALQAKLTPVERDILKDRYNSIIAQLNEDIHQQQLITGAAMSTERKLFWGAVAAGAVVAGMYLLAPGTEITSDVVKDLENAVVITPEEPKTQPVEPAAQVIPAENAATSNLPGKSSLADVMNLNEDEEEVLTQSVTPDNEGVTPDNEGVAPDNEGVTPDNEGVTPDNEGVAPDNEEVAPDNEEVAPDNEGVTPDNEGITPDNEGVTPDNEGVAPDNEGVTPDNEGITLVSEQQKSMNELIDDWKKERQGYYADFNAAMVDSNDPAKEELIQGLEKRSSKYLQENLPYEPGFNPEEAAKVIKDLRGEFQDTLSGYDEWKKERQGYYADFNAAMVDTNDPVKEAFIQDLEKRSSEYLQEDLPYKPGFNSQAVAKIIKDLREEFQAALKKFDEDVTSNEIAKQIENKRVKQEDEQFNDIQRISTKIDEDSEQQELLKAEPISDAAEPSANAINDEEQQSILPTDENTMSQQKSLVEGINQESTQSQDPGNQGDDQETEDSFGGDDKFKPTKDSLLPSEQEQGGEEDYDGDLGENDNIYEQEDILKSHSPINPISQKSEKKKNE